MTYLISFLVLTFSIFAMDTTSCDTASQKPKIVRSHKAPKLGQYIKVSPYYVTAGRNDPYSEEILYFLIAKELKEVDKKIGTTLDYMKFHKYFKQKLSILEKQKEIDKSYEPISYDETYPIIQAYFKTRGQRIPDKNFKQMIEKNKEKIDELKDIFAIKSNTTYYEVYPIDAQVKLNQTSTLPTATLKSGTTSLVVTIAASNLTLYSSISEENKDKLSLINSNLTELKYIYSILPSKGAPLKESLKKFINQELE